MFRRWECQLSHHLVGVGTALAHVEHLNEVLSLHVASVADGHVSEILLEQRGHFFLFAFIFYDVFVFLL